MSAREGLRVVRVNRSLALAGMLVALAGILALGGIAVAASVPGASTDTESVLTESVGNTSGPEAFGVAPAGPLPIDPILEGPAILRPADLNQTEVVSVDYSAQGLSPRVVAVDVGGSVRWTNRDSVSHNTTHLPPAGRPSLWNSYEIAPDGVFSHTFSTPGTYHYFDFYEPDNPALQGVVVVTTGGVPPTPTPGGATAEPTTPTTSPPTQTPAPTATPTAAPAIVTGILRAGPGDCDADASLTLCETGATLLVRTAAGDLRAYDGYPVRIDGVLGECPASGQRVIDLLSIQTLTGPCGNPTATPEPEPTAGPGGNLARGGAVRASMQVPGYPATHLTDGDPGSLWYASAPTAWAYVDLGSEQTFNQVVLNWSKPYSTRFGLYVWDPGRGEWTALYWKDPDPDAPADPPGNGRQTVSLKPTYGRFVLVYMVESSADESAAYALGEFEVYGRERPNLALGSAVVASGSDDCCPPWHAVDADYSTGWASPRGQANPWIRLHLPPDTEISDLRLFWDDWAHPATYSLVFYHGGNARQLIIPQAPGGLNRFEFLSPIKADALLVYTHYLNQAGLVGLAEAEIFGQRLSQAFASDHERHPGDVDRLSLGTPRAPTSSRLELSPGTDGTDITGRLPYTEPALDPTTRLRPANGVHLTGPTGESFEVLEAAPQP